jgi:hypothetical protein
VAAKAATHYLMIRLFLALCHVASLQKHGYAVRLLGRPVGSKQDVYDWKAIPPGDGAIKKSSAGSFFLLRWSFTSAF